jgi:predicted dehydrogenase
MRKVRWGVLSTAKIGTVKVIPGMQRAVNCEMVAVASRNLDTARQAALSLGLPKAYGSYEELLADPDIDAIYNPLPNHLHVPWSLRAIEAGKHVLCEKPIALTSAEGQQLVDAVRRNPQLKVMEAFMYRHHPQWQRAKRLAQESIGELRTIQTFFAYFNDNPDDIRNAADIGGGGLFDIGCYAISLSRFVFDAEPRRVIGLVEFDPQFKTDRLASAILDFGNRTSTFTCSTQLVPRQRVNIYGTSGRVEIEIPFNAPPDRPCRVFHETDGKAETIEIPTCDQYTIQGELFSQAILDDAPVPTPIEDSVANMRVIEAILESGRTNRWVELT